MLTGRQAAGSTHLRLPAPGAVGAGRGPERTAVDPRASAGPKSVVLTVSELTGDVTKALKGGARGYVLKGVGHPSCPRWRWRTLRLADLVGASSAISRRGPRTDW